MIPGVGYYTALLPSELEGEDLRALNFRKLDCLSREATRGRGKHTTF